MSPGLTSSPLSYAVGYLVALAALPFLLSRTRNTWAEKALFALAAVVLVIRSAWRLTGGFISWDLIILRLGGETALKGASPYDVEIYVSPPSAVPLHEFLALFSLPVSHRIWLVANTLMLLLLPYVSWRVLANSGPGAAARTGPFPYAAGACILLAYASVYGIDAGQMQLITTLFMLAALWLKDRGRPILAGLSLAAATVKVTMMMPVLTQFCDRRGRRAWIGLAAGVVALSAVSAPIARLPDRYRQSLANIAAISRPDGMNDYTFENKISEDLVSISRWLYCLGLRDRSAIRLLEYGIAGAIGIALAWASATRRIAPDAAAAASFTLGAFFLYHRMYDAVVLAPALIYCVAASRREAGWRRVAFTAAALAILAVMDMPRGDRLWSLARWSVDAGAAGRLVQIFVLPYAVWCLLGAMGVLCFASRRDGGAGIEEASRTASP